MQKKVSYMLVIILLILSASSLVLFFNYPTRRAQLDIKKIKNWAYQLQNADPNEIASSGFDLIVMDYSWDGSDENKYTREDIEKIKDAGIIPIAYISIGEAEDYRFYWREEWYTDPPEWLGRENPDWLGNYPVKYWYSEWKEIIFKYLDKIIAQGFMGIYLDRVDVFEYWSDPNNGEEFYIPEREAAERMISFIVEIANYCRNKTSADFYIIPQNGERLLEYDNGTLLKIISGWAVEDLFYNGTEPLPEYITNERMYYLDKVLNAGEVVLVVDYVDDGSGYIGTNKERIDDFRAKALARGYIPYAAIVDRELDELNIIEGVQP